MECIGDQKAPEQGHAYLHNIESFSHVFKRMCICYGHVDRSNVAEVPRPGGSNLVEERKLPPTRQAWLVCWLLFNT